MRVSYGLLVVAHAAFAAAALAQAPAGRIEGTITDSLRKEPLAGATLIALPDHGTHDTLFHSVMSDGRGRFAFSALNAGSYVLTAEHPRLDSSGLVVPYVRVNVPPDGAVTTALAVPSVQTLRRVFCRAAMTDTTVGAFVGVVRRMDGVPIAGATVVFSWTDFEVNRKTAAVSQKEFNASVRSDSNGVYRACGLPVARTLLAQAQVGTTDHSVVIAEQIGLAGVLVRDFHVGAAADSTTARTLEVTAAGRFAITGRVLDADGIGIDGARVKLFGTNLAAVTNAAGEYHLTSMPGGLHGVEVEAAGHHTKRVRVAIGDETPSVVVVLARSLQQGDSSSGRAARHAEFDQRKGNLLGRFVTEGDIRLKRPFLLSDLLGASSNCMSVFVDGAADSDIDRVAPSLIYGVEIYRTGEVPTSYRDTGCGTVLIWTR